MTTFPVPPDNRLGSDFQVTKGWDMLQRTPAKIYDKTKSYLLGEFIKRDASGNALKLVTGVDVIATPALGARINWTKFVPNDFWNGMPDAVATGQLDLLSGLFTVNTKFFDTGATYTPGCPLVAIYDATLGGILAPLDPAGPPTARQLAAVVGTFVSKANGYLTAEIKL